MEKFNVPEEVQQSYEINASDQLKIVGGGLINTTLVVENNKEQKYILQRIHPVIEPEQTEDYAVISARLRMAGWAVPLLRPTVAGDLYATDYQGSNWRAFEYVDSDSPEEAAVLDHDNYGTLLGKLHTSLKEIDYDPKFKIPNFHNTYQYSKDPYEALPHFKDKHSIQIAKYALQYQVSRELPYLPPQIIHADPKMANILTRNGIPFTFIDWDTAMKGTPWIDIGDMLRSVISHNEKNGSEDHILNNIYGIIDAYYNEARPAIEHFDFVIYSLQATSDIMLELAIRYLADYKDGDEGYFGWDSSLFSTRHEHNVHKAERILLGMGIIDKITNGMHKITRDAERNKIYE